jgi:hypothetical protein
MDQPEQQQHRPLPPLFGDHPKPAGTDRCGLLRGIGLQLCVLLSRSASDFLGEPLQDCLNLL